MKTKTKKTKVDAKTKGQLIYKPWLRKLNDQKNFVECNKRVVAKK